MLKKNKTGITAFIILTLFILFFPYEGIYDQLNIVSGSDSGISLLRIESETGIYIPNIVTKISVIALVLLVTFQLSVVIQTFSDLFMKKIKRGINCRK